MQPFFNHYTEQSRHYRASQGIGNEKGLLTLLPEKGDYKNKGGVMMRSYDEEL